MYATEVEYGEVPYIVTIVERIWQPFLTNLFNGSYLRVHEEMGQGTKGLKR